MLEVAEPIIQVSEHLCFEIVNQIMSYEFMGLTQVWNQNCLSLDKLVNVWFDLFELFLIHTRQIFEYIFCAEKIFETKIYDLFYLWLRLWRYQIWESLLFFSRKFSQIHVF